MDTTIQKAKSYWSRPEGKTGMLILGGGIAAVAYGWGRILPFLVDMMANTLKLGMLTAGVIVLGLVAFSPRTHMIFRLITRAITGLIITIDPIGILKDRLAQMMKRREEMEEQVKEVRGAVGTLKQAISDNTRNASELKKKAAEARSQMEMPGGDPERHLRMASQLKINANEAGRLDKANERYMDLLMRLEKIYKVLTTLGVSIDTYIQDTSNEVRQQEIQFKTIGKAHKAFASAMKVLKGNATEEDIYNTTMEYLADEAGRKLGEMEDMQRIAQGFMDKIDIENGVMTDDALKMLDAFEVKALPPASPKVSLPASKETVEVTRPTAGQNKYF